MANTYVYAILEGEPSLRLGDVGLPDGNTRVSSLSAGGLSAVVSDYSGRPFPELPRAEVLRSLTIHQMVIERAMAECPVLPVKFGTTLASVGEVRSALRRWKSRLVASFEELGNVVEIEVAAVWDLKTVFTEISRQPEIAALAASIGGGSMEATLTRRSQIGQLVKEALDARREEYRRLVVRELSPCARAVQANPILSDEMVVNSAFLVERSGLDAFFEAVHQVDRVFEDRLTFRCIGPLPPYSFATVEILRPSADVVETARQLLEVDEATSEKELKSSFRRLSGRCHPDRNRQDPTASRRFAALSGAYATLVACGRSQQDDNSPLEAKHRLDFSRSTVEAGIYLTIGRQETQQEPSGDESHEFKLAV